MSAAHMATTTLRVSGMTCGACTSAVEGGFTGRSGVGNVSVSLVLERAVVVHDPSQISAEEIKAIIDDLGFDAEILSTDLPSTSFASQNAPSGGFSSHRKSVRSSPLATTTLSIGGMTCGACTSAVEGAFKNVEGVKSFSISLLSERAVIGHDQNILPAARLVEMIEDIGFEAAIVDTKMSASPLAVETCAFAASPKMATTVAISGMTCGACTSAIETGFKDVAGVDQFNISLLAERAVIVHDPAKLSAEKIASIIEDRGFDAEILSSVEADLCPTASSASLQLKIYGMPDKKAAQELEDVLNELTGVTQAIVNFVSSKASITHSPSAIGLRAIVDAVEHAGYSALLADSDDNNAQLASLAKTKEIQEWKKALYISSCFAIPVFLTSMLFPMFLPFLDYGSIKLPVPGLWLGDLVCLCLTIPVQFGIGRRFYISAYKSLRHGSPTMDVLVVLGTSAAFFFSVGTMLVAVFSSPHDRPATVFDTSTMLITFITLGRYLENGAKSQTSKALSRLMSLAPSMATIYADPIAAARLAEGWQLDPTNEKKTGIADTSAAFEEKNIPTELIQVGDVVVLRPGDKIAADGIVLRGESYINESMVTGEAMPVAKKPGSLLMAGTVNDAGRLDFKVTRAGRDTQLSQIVRLVQEAQTSRATIQRAADRVAGYFVPIIIALGLVTFIGWMVLSHILPNPPKVFMEYGNGGRFMVCLKLCISVIVFACPCALGLATPTAVMVGTGIGAERGILVKGGAALEKAAKVTHVVFDKTGTLTTGKMSLAVADIKIPLTEASNAKAWKRIFWAAVGLAETSSEHPIGRAIVRAAKDEIGVGPDDSLEGTVDEFTNTAGKGISASISAIIDGKRETHRVLAGTTSLLRSHGVPLPDLPSHDTSSRTSLDQPDAPTPGATIVHIAIDSSYAGSLSMSDTLKPTARAAVLALERLGITSTLITGDSAEAAHYFARLVGIPPERVHSSAAPPDKQRFVSSIKAQGQVVAMVGDGINDSPALATADIGMSLASGTDVAIETADVVLMRGDDLLLVPAALHLARHIFKRIKLNLLWACLYNAVGLPFAMGALLPWGFSLHPMAAGAAMACSSVSVVCSSLLLRLWKRPVWMEVDVLEGRVEEPRQTRGVAFSRLGSEYFGRLMRLGRAKARDDHEGVSYVPLQEVEDV